MDMICYYEGLCIDAGNRCNSCRWRFGYRSYYEPVVENRERQVSHSDLPEVSSEVDKKLINTVLMHS